MFRRDTGVILLAALGLTAAALALVDILRVGDTFGYPGSLLYDRYEAFNRRMAVLLAAQLGGLAAFARAYLGGLPRTIRASLGLLGVAGLLMIAGTAAEFWLFSDLPYGSSNARSFAFGLFVAGLLVAGFTFLVLGVQLLRYERGSVPLAHLFIILLPLAIAFVVGGRSLFLLPALGATALSLSALAVPGHDQVDALPE